MSDAQTIHQILALLNPSPLWELLRSVTPLQWTAVLIGPVLHVAAPLLRRVWPSFGGGRSLFRAPLRRKSSFWTFWHLRAWTTVFPLGLGFLSASNSAAPFLILGGLSNLVFVLASQRGLRTTVELLDHSYRFNGLLYRYDTLIEARPVDEGYELVAPKGSILVSAAQYEALRPTLWAQGIGGKSSGGRVELRGDLNLK